MPIDTRDKRASVLGVNLSFPRMEQNPSGAIAQSGRQIAGLVYSGILAATPSTFNPAWANDATAMISFVPSQPIIR